MFNKYNQTTFFDILSDLTAKDRTQVGLWDTYELADSLQAEYFGDNDLPGGIEYEDEFWKNVTFLSE